MPPLSAWGTGRLWGPPLGTRGRAWGPLLPWGAPRPPQALASRLPPRLRPPGQDTLPAWAWPPPATRARVRRGGGSCVRPRAPFALPSWGRPWGGSRSDPRGPTLPRAVGSRPSRELGGVQGRVWDLGKGLGARRWGGQAGGGRCRSKYAGGSSGSRFPRTARGRRQLLGADPVGWAAVTLGPRPARKTGRDGTQAGLARNLLLLCPIPYSRPTGRRCRVSVPAPSRWRLDAGRPVEPLGLRPPRPRPQSGPVQTSMPGAWLRFPFPLPFPSPLCWGLAGDSGATHPPPSAPPPTGFPRARARPFPAPWETPTSSLPPPRNLAPSVALPYPRTPSPPPPPPPRTHCHVPILPSPPSSRGHCQAGGASPAAQLSLLGQDGDSAPVGLRGLSGIPFGKKATRSSTAQPAREPHWLPFPKREPWRCPSRVAWGPLRSPLPRTPPSRPCPGLCPWPTGPGSPCPRLEAAGSSANGRASWFPSGAALPPLPPRLPPHPRGCNPSRPATASPPDPPRRLCGPGPRAVLPHAALSPTASPPWAAGPVSPRRPRGPASSAAGLEPRWSPCASSPCWCCWPGWGPRRCRPGAQRR